MHKRKSLHGEPSFRAWSQDHRSLAGVKAEAKCAHHVLTSLKFPVFTRDSAVLVDSQSVGMEVI